MAERFLIVRLGAMGDILHTLPAVAALRRTHGDAVIGWAIEKRWADLLCTPEARKEPRSEAKPLVDIVHFVNTRDWRENLFSGATLEAASRSFRRIREMGYDVALDFQGAWKSAMVAVVSHAPRIVGFAQPRERPASLFYDRALTAQGKHIIEQNLSLTAGMTERPTLQAEFPLPHDPAAEDWCDRQVSRLGSWDYVILNPGAGWGSKCWPVERYAEVARALASSGLVSLVNYGPGEEKLVRELESSSRGSAQGISCSVAELIALTRRARLFVGGDTGPLHLAAALEIPVVGIYGPTDPARNGPYQTRSVVLRSKTSTTNHSRRAAPDEGLLSIAAGEAIAAARSLLELPAWEIPRG